MPAWRRDRAPRAGEQPRSSQRRLGGGGTGEGADPEGPGQASGPAPSPPSRARGPTRVPCAALQFPSGRRSGPLWAPALGAGVSAAATAVRRVTERAPPPGWGLGLQLPEREEKGEVKGKDPRKCPLLSAGEEDAGGGVPYLPPAWLVRPG